MRRAPDSQNLAPESRSVEQVLEIAAILLVITWLLGLAAGYAFHPLVRAVALTAAVVLVARIVRSLGK